MSDPAQVVPGAALPAPVQQAAAMMPPSLPLEAQLQADAAEATAPEGAPEELDPNAMDLEEDDDGGVIRCICRCEDDDGFTIQCDQCLVWQHCACMGMTSEAMVPETYLCEQCDPDPKRKVDPIYAHALQQRRRQDEQRRASLIDMLQKEQRSGRQISETEAQWLAQQQQQQQSMQEQFAPEASSPVVSAAVPAPAATGRSRKQTLPSIDLSNAGFVMPTAGQASTPGGKSSSNKRKSHATTPSISGLPTPKPRAAGRHDAEEDDRGALDEVLQEAWRVEFTPLTRNLVADRSVLVVLQNAMRPYERLGESPAGLPPPLRAHPNGSGKWVAPVVRTKAQKAKAADAAKMQDMEVDETPDVSEGLTAVGNECVPVEISAAVESLQQIRLRTYVKQISEAASASIFSNVLSIATPATEPQRIFSKSFSRPVMHGLFAEQFIPAGSFIMELKGELSSADSYRKDPRNMYDLIGCTKPHTHILPPPLNLSIDSRRFGNEGRFARFGCHPNAVLRPILFRRLPDADADESEIEPELLFGLFALSDISKMHEITLGWEWDDMHIVHLLPRLVDNPLLESSGRHIAALSTAARQEIMLSVLEKGEFPYANTLFSAKMSSVTTTLLGSALCACIGSASAPGGNISASANNGKRQDCAVVQMLRVGQGMSLLNVQMPGKSNRKSKLPDFSPLVGVRRWWRPIIFPPTPISSTGDPFDEQIEEEADEVRSQASSLTEALSVLSDSDAGSNASASRVKADTSDVPKVLPPKKRISGTRIKATYSDSEDSEHRHGEEREKYISAATAGASSTRGKRKAKRASVAIPPLEDLPKKRRASTSSQRPKQARRLTNRSSPLSPISSEAEGSEESESEASASEEDIPHSKRSERPRRDRAAPTLQRPSQKRKARAAEKTRRMLLKLAADDPASSSSSSSSDSDSSDSRASEEESDGDRRRASNRSRPAKEEARAKKRSAPRVMDSSNSEPSDEEPAAEREDKANESHIHVSAADISKGAVQAESNMESPGAVAKKEDASTSAAGAAPEPEQPRAKMSLSDYRRRLMEKRTSTAGKEEEAPKTPAVESPTSLFPGRVGLSNAGSSLLGSSLPGIPKISTTGYFSSEATSNVAPSPTAATSSKPPFTASLGLGKLPTFSRVPIPAAGPPATTAAVPSAPSPISPQPMAAAVPAPKPYQPEQNAGTPSEPLPSPRTTQPSPRMRPFGGMGPPPSMPLTGPVAPGPPPPPHVSPREKRKPFDHGFGASSFAGRPSDSGWASRPRGMSMQGGQPQAEQSPTLQQPQPPSAPPQRPPGMPTSPSQSFNPNPFGLREARSGSTGSFQLLADDTPKDHSSAGMPSFSPPAGPFSTLTGAPGGRPGGFAPVNPRMDRAPSIPKVSNFDPPKGPRALMAGGPAGIPAPSGPRGSLPLSGSNAVLPGGPSMGRPPAVPPNIGLPPGGPPVRRDFSGIPSGPRVRDDDMMPSTGANAIGVGMGMGIGMNMGMGMGMAAGDRDGPEPGALPPFGGLPPDARDARGGFPPERPDFRGSGFHPPPRGNGWAGRARIRGGPRGGHRGGARIRGRGGWGPPS